MPLRRMDVRDKVLQRPPLGHFPDCHIPNTTLQFFSDFGPDLCRMWHPIHRHLPQAATFATRDIETAGILQGLRTPAAQTLELDIDASAAVAAAAATAQQHQMLYHQAAAGGAMIEPTLLQPQEWLGPYGGIGNWLMVDWDQSLGW